MAKKNPRIATKAPKAQSGKSHSSNVLTLAVMPSPTWSKWGLMPHAELWQLVALSLNIEPEYVRTLISEYAWMPAPNGPISLDLYEEFNIRLDVAKESRSELDITESGIRSFETCKYTFASFSMLANVFNWSLPKEFPRENSIKKPKYDPANDHEKEQPLKEHERITLLKQIGILSLALAEKNPKYKRGNIPNASLIAEFAHEIAEHIPDIELKGLSVNYLRVRIADALKLLKGE